MKTTLLFDLDGTLVNSIPTVLSSFRATFSELNAEHPGDEIIQRGIGSALEVILAPYFPEEKIPKAIKIYREKYLEQEKNITLFPETFSALSRLASSSRMGVVTTKLRSFAESLLEQIGILDFFEFVIGGEDAARCKPHPDPLLLAAERLGVSPEKAFYIGDSEHDAKSATAAKMPFLGVATGTASVAELQVFGKVFANLEEIADFFLNEQD